MSTEIDQKRVSPSQIPTTTNGKDLKSLNRSTFETLKQQLLEFGYKSFYYSQSKAIRPDLLVQDQAALAFMAIRDDMNESINQVKLVLKQFRTELTTLLNEKTAASTCFNLAHQKLIEIEKILGIE